MNVYVAELGESLFNIADMYNVDIQAMLAANPHIWDPKYLAQGEQVKIPNAPKQPELFGCVPSGDPYQTIITDQPCPEGLSEREDNASEWRTADDGTYIQHTSWDIDEEQVSQITKMPNTYPTIKTKPFPKEQHEAFKQHVLHYMTQPFTAHPHYPLHAQGYYHGVQHNMQPVPYRYQTQQHTAYYQAYAPQSYPVKR